MDPITHQQALQTRRQFFGRSAVGVGTAAVVSLLNRDAAVANSYASAERFGGLPTVPHFAPKAKRVIYLFMNGARRMPICLTLSQR